MLTPLSQWIVDQAAANPNPTDAQVIAIKTRACELFGASREQVQYSIKNMRKTGRIPSNWGFDVGRGAGFYTVNQNASESIVSGKSNYQEKLNSSVGGNCPKNPDNSVDNPNAGLNGFRQLYDKGLTIPLKIQAGIDTYLKRNGWMYDDDFRRACGVKSTDWRRFTREFEHLQLRVDGGVLVWGHPSIIEQMREVALA